MNFIPIISDVLDKIFPDKTQSLNAKLKVIELQAAGELKGLDAQMQSILAEAKGESWLQRNWRPLTMITFVSLVVCKWLGITSPGVTEAVELELMALIKIGLGGYVLGRSAEKVVKTWKG